MNVENLKTAIRAVIESHPEVYPSPRGHTKKVWRYCMNNGTALAFEHLKGSEQNIWVAAENLSTGAFADLVRSERDHTTFHASRPNSNLFTEPELNGRDLVCIKVRSWWDVARIVREVAGDGAAT